jgi:hypothetical protein
VDELEKERKQDEESARDDEESNEVADDDDSINDEGKEVGGINDEGKEVVVGDEGKEVTGSKRRKAHKPSLPEDDYFPVYLLAFVVYGPMSKEPYHALCIPNDEGMGKIPENNDPKPMSRRDLQDAKAEFLEASRGSEGKRKDSSSKLDHFGEGILEELKRQRLSAESDRKIFEKQRRITKLEKKIDLLKKLGREDDVVHAQEMLLLLLDEEDDEEEAL